MIFSHIPSLLCQCNCGIQMLRISEYFTDQGISSLLLSSSRATSTQTTLTNVIVIQLEDLISVGRLPTRHFASCGLHSRRLLFNQWFFRAWTLVSISCLLYQLITVLTFQAAKLGSSRVKYTVLSSKVCHESDDARKLLTAAAQKNNPRQIQTRGGISSCYGSCH